MKSNARVTFEADFAILFGIKLSVRKNNSLTENMHKTLVTLVLLAAYTLAAQTSVTILADDFVRLTLLTCLRYRLLEPG